MITMHPAIMIRWPVRGRIMPAAPTGDGNARRVRLTRIAGCAVAAVLAVVSAAVGQTQSISIPANQGSIAHPASGDVAASRPDTTADAASIWQRNTLTGDWGGVRTSLETAGVQFGLQEQSEVWGNLTGGLRRGAVYDGLTTASITLDLAKLVGWSEAKSFVSAYQFHGHGPSVSLVGNLEDVSSIESTPATRLYALWLEQGLLNGRLNIRIGQGSASDELMVTQYGALFLNSSFGVPGLLTVDLPSGGPVSPLATPFARVRYQATDRITLIAALFNGDPAPPGTGDPQRRDKGGTAFRLNDHVLAFSEVWYAINQDPHDPGLPGTYKLGAWYSSSHFADQLHDTRGLSLANPASTGIPRGHSTGFAVYGIFDQMIWRRPGAPDQGVGVFVQVMGVPDAFNLSNLFVAAGINVTAPFPHRVHDVVGLGVAYLGIGAAARRLGSDAVFYTGTGSLYQGNETAIEATYLYQVAPWWTLQPDAQIVVNPGAGIPTSAAPTPLKNAVILGMRATITF